MKIKANELMIGDWVQIVSDAPIMPNEYHRIDWIRTGEVGLDNRKIVTYPYIQPIPLTLEILEKNGMRNGYEAYYVSYSQNDKSWYFVYDSDSCSLNVLISNVHELQHALRFCGIEKTIEL